MMRYVPEEQDDGTLVLVNDEDDADRVEVGHIDDVLAAVGSDTHVIEYDERQRTQPWLDDDGRLDIEVRETVTELPHTPEFVAELRGYEMDTERYGLPTRTVEFAKGFLDILDQQGAE